MLTRSEVAKRLKKSIATVRRLEGRVLFPVIGRHRVRLFNRREVEELRESPELAAGLGQSDWFVQEVDAVPPMRARTKQQPQEPPTRITTQSSSRARADALEVLESMLGALLDAPARDLLRVGITEEWIDAAMVAVDVLRADDVVSVSSEASPARPGSPSHPRQGRSPGRRSADRA